MPNPNWEDLSEFFDPDEFAALAVISRDGGTIGEVLGIFEDPTEVAALGDYELDNPTPKFVCRASDVVDTRKGDVLTVDGRALDVMQDPELDGTGLATLVLSEPGVIYGAGL